MYVHVAIYIYTCSTPGSTCRRLSLSILISRLCPCVTARLARPFLFLLSREREAAARKRLTRARTLPRPHTQRLPARRPAPACSAPHAKPSAGQACVYFIYYIYIKIDAGGAVRENIRATHTDTGTHTHTHRRLRHCTASNTSRPASPAFHSARTFGGKCASSKTGTFAHASSLRNIPLKLELVRYSSS